MEVPHLIDALGGPAKVGAAIGDKANTVATWKKRGRIPGERWGAVALLADRMGIPRHELRPDLWPAPAEASA